MTDYQPEAIAALRQLTLQIMLISAGVFGIVGGFVSSAGKKFIYRYWLASALILFAVSTVFGYLLHGIIISMLANNHFDAFNLKLTAFGALQIGLFILGGLFFIVFVIKNIGR